MQMSGKLSDQGKWYEAIKAIPCFSAFTAFHGRSTAEAQSCDSLQHCILCHPYLVLNLLTGKLGNCLWPVERSPYGYHEGHLGCKKSVPSVFKSFLEISVDSWWRGTVVRTFVFGWRTFPVLRSACSWWVTIYVGKPSATGQPTRPTQPFILLRSINWVVSCNWMFASSHKRRHLVNVYGVKAWCGWLEWWCVL